VGVREGGRALSRVREIRGVGWCCLDEERQLLNTYATTIKEPTVADGLPTRRGHRITVEPSNRHVRAVRGDQVLAESDEALVLHEEGSPDAYYIPSQDVRLDLLTPSDTRTNCPFKGDASYWSLPDAADLAWAYLDPKPEVAEIKNHVCFYEVQVF
jgi:uncharacterized protein (DUF427 family)